MGTAYRKFVSLTLSLFVVALLVPTLCVGMLCLRSAPATAQDLTHPAGSSNWAITYGGAAADGVGGGTGGTSIRNTPIAGGFIVVGTSASFGLTADIWVVKLAPNGDVQWQNTYANPLGAGADTAADVREVTGGGYVVVGTTVVGAGDTDIWVLRLNATGVLIWNRTYGGVFAGLDTGWAIQQTTDGGFVVVGTITIAGGNTDVWILKLNSAGAITWQVAYGLGAGTLDVGRYIQQTTDGGYIVLGEIATTVLDIWVLKLNSDGTLAWNRTYGGAAGDVANTIQQTSDGGYIVFGDTASFGAGINDLWVLKLSSAGVIQWEKTYGGAGTDFSWLLSPSRPGILQTSDGGYIVAGTTASFVDPAGDLWVLKLDSGGLVSGGWSRTYGGAAYDGDPSVQETSDGFVIAGTTFSFGDPVAGDILVLKLATDGTIPFCPQGANTPIVGVDSVATVTPAVGLVTTPTAIAPGTVLAPGVNPTGILENVLCFAAPTTTTTTTTVAPTTVAPTTTTTTTTVAPTTVAPTTTTTTTTTLPCQCTVASGCISGQVTNGAGKTVKAKRKGAPAAIATVGPDGCYQFSGLADGTYKVKVKKCKKGGKKSATIAGNNANSVNFTCQ